MAKPRLLLADDHELVLAAFTKLLEAKFDVAGTVTDGLALLKRACELKPDVIVLDLGMPRLNGMDAGEEIKKKLPSTKIIVLTMNEDFELAAHALRHWASAYLLKKSAASELDKAIHAVMEGRTYVTPKIAQRLVEEFVRDPRPGHEKHLTQRQKQVLQLLAEGRTMKEVGALLDISTRTVAFHKYQIMEEHDLKTQSDIVMFAIKNRIIAPPL
jgi:DNA-binding NarL/FixJ family response regulator